MIIKGGKEKAIQFMDGLKLASNEVHVADVASRFYKLDLRAKFIEGV